MASSLQVVALCLACLAAPAMAKPQAAALLQRIASKQLRESAPTTLPVTVHDKKAGNGYLPGSPLYAKQQQLEKEKGRWFYMDAHGKKFSFWQWIGTIIANVIIFAIFAYLYTLWKPEVTKQPTVGGKPWFPPFIEENPNYCGGFNFSLIGCLDAPQLCLTACCCGVCRWAHTEHLASVWNYWRAVLVMGLLVVLSPLTAGFTGLIALCVATKFRQDLRRRMGFKNVGGMSIVEDCCTYWCCGCCAVVQEARQIEHLQRKATSG